MHFNLEITRNCNQKCFYCFNDSGSSHHKNDLSLTEWKNILSKIHALGHKSVLITGGEPFLHPDIIEILQHAIGLGLETSILSNGYKISAFVEKYPFLFSMLRLAQISLDAIDPEVHNMRRGYNKAFKDAISAINALQKVNVPIEISTTVSDQSLSQLIDVAKYCESIDASLIIRELIPTGRGKTIDTKRADNLTRKKIVRKLYAYTTANVVYDRFNYVADNDKCDKCFKIYGTVTVECSGVIKGNNVKSHTINSFLCQLKVA
jgi:MoaA/NifB/PqqE/SkfB family radical SAM enzyme